MVNEICDFNWTCNWHKMHSFAILTLTLNIKAFQYIAESSNERTCVSEQVNERQQKLQFHIKSACCSHVAHSNCHF